MAQITINEGQLVPSRMKGSAGVERASRRRIVEREGTHGSFYARAGFHECPVDPMMMMITLAEVEKNLSPPSAS